MERLRAHYRDETGMTLVELVVVSALLLVVGGIVTTGVLSAHGVTRHADARVEALTTIHQAVARVSREIRAADSGDPTETAVINAALRSASPTSLETDIFRGEPLQRIRFTYTVVDGTLTERRQIWAAGAAVTDAPTSDATRTLLRALVTDGNRPLFAYRASDGSCLSGCVDAVGTYIGTAVPAADLGEIAEVQLQVRRSLGDGQSPIEVVTRVALRNA